MVSMNLHALTAGGKKCRNYKGSKFGGLGAITPERLGAQRPNFACA